MWLRVQLLYVNNNGTSALWSAGPWIKHRHTPEWVARHTKPFKSVLDSSVCTCQLVHTHGQCLTPWGVLAPKMWHLLKCTEREAGVNEDENREEKKLGKFLQFLVVPESSLNVRLFLETPDDLLPPGTNVTHAGVNIAMWDQLDTVWLALGPPCPNAVGRHATVTVSHSVTWNLWLLLWNMTIKAPRGAFV